MQYYREYRGLVIFRLNYKGDLKTTPTLVTGDGDGTVNARSLKSCEMWSGMKAQREKTIHSIEIPGVDHMRILSDKRVVEYVLNILVQNKTYDIEESEQYDYRHQQQLQHNWIN